MSVADIRVLVCSANPLARGGLEALVQGMDGLKAIGSSDSADAASLAAQLLPDAVLLDTGQGELEELDAIGRLAAAQPGLPIVAIGQGGQAALTQALAFGASSVLPSAVDRETLRLALLAAVRGLVTIPRPEVTALLPDEERTEPSTEGPAESLTPRELEVLQLMARGLTNRQIGQRLQISEHTVKFHAAAILGKLNARSRAEAVARAIGFGWILV